jgi:Undecaprenyl-phosphate glucose phosphotransferase
VSNNETPDQFRYTPPLAEKVEDIKSLITPTPGAIFHLRLDFVCLVEITVVAALGYLIAQFYVGGVLEVANFSDRYIWPVLLLPLAMALIFQRSGLYELTSITDIAGSLGNYVSGVVGTFVSFTMLAVILGISDDYSRVWYGGWLASSLVAIWITRALAAFVFSRWVQRGAIRKRAVVIGGGSEVDAFVERFSPKNRDFQIVGLYGHSEGQHPPISGDVLNDLIEMGRRSELDVVIVEPPTDDPETLGQILNSLSMLSVEIKVIAPKGLSHVSLMGISRQGQNQFIDIQRSEISARGRILKFVMDNLVAGVALIALSWLLLLIALAIRLESRGPALFKQRRTGLNNKEFMIFKFRTMRQETGPSKFRQAQRGDSRVTRLGRFLRRTSLDELPQLFNVLRGDMSVVGPRPHPVELNLEYAPQLYLFNKRHSVKPGITGWAQIHDHRGPIATPDGMHQRLSYDLYYIYNWSTWFDMKIIAATPLMGLIHRNAV